MEYLSHGALLGETSKTIKKSKQMKHGNIRRLTLTFQHLAGIVNFSVIELRVGRCLLNSFQ